MKVLDWYKGNKKMRIEQVEIVISKIIKMSYINGSREIRKELEEYVRTSEGFIFFYHSYTKNCEVITHCGFDLHFLVG